MWTRNNDVLNWNMLKHFIYLSSDKSTTSSLCSLYYKYSSKSSSFFYILSFLVRATSIDQTFYSATHYLVAVWLDSRHDLNIDWSKSRSAVLTSVKNADVLVETCFICHKSDHSFRECLNQSIKVNAVDENYDHFELDTESEFKSKN